MNWMDGTLYKKHRDPRGECGSAERQCQSVTTIVLSLFSDENSNVELHQFGQQDYTVLGPAKLSLIDNSVV